MKRAWVIVKPNGKITPVLYETRKEALGFLKGCVLRRHLFVDLKKPSFTVQRVRVCPHCGGKVPEANR